MWKQPWGYKEGYVICFGLILVGILLQMSIGALHTDFLLFPVNAFIGIIYLISIAILFIFSVWNKTIRWFSGMEASITAISVFLILVVIMGLTRQSATPDNAGILEVLGFNNMLLAWAFVMIFVYMMSVLGLVILRRLMHFHRGKDIPFMLNHLGLFITLLAAVLGSADIHRYQIIVGKDSPPEWRVSDENGKMKEMDLAIKLNNFTIDEYPPKLMLIDNNSGKTLPDKQPVILLINKKPLAGSLLDWNITVSQMIENSAPMVEKDSVKFVEFHSTGAATAVFVKATHSKTGKSVTGWVSSGSYLFPYRALKLDKNVSVVMPEREPKRFASDVNVYTKSGKMIHSVIEVNKPLKVNGWEIYQISYDERMGKWSNTCTFELVKDPWIGLVYTGLIMMILGALGLFIFGNPTPKSSIQQFTE
ncbi:MAG: cytochrome c biogenesis protein ResB [Paludibacteraceae bacterium]